MNKYSLRNIKGDGTYGTVYAAINTETNAKVAIKKLKSKIYSFEECMEQNEVKFLRKIHHPNIVKLLEVIREPSSDVSFVFEYCDCNLYELTEQYIKKKSHISEETIKNIIKQIVQGLAYLHKNGIMHRDLKPENILYIFDTEEIKLADFGVTKEVPDKKDGKLTDYVCTRWYRAPECVLKSKDYDEKVDIWAVGCVMAELIMLKPIFPGNNEFDQINTICKVMGTPRYDEWPEGYKLLQKMNMRLPNFDKTDLSKVVKGASPEAIDFLEYIFTYNPDKRPSAEQLLKHRYLNDNNTMRPSTFSFANRRSKLRRGLSIPARGNYDSEVGTQSLGSINTNSNNETIPKNPFLSGSMSNHQLINSYGGSYKNNNNYINSYNDDKKYTGSYSNNNSNIMSNYYGTNYQQNEINKYTQTNNYRNTNFDYLKNLNYNDYVKNGRVIPDINGAFASVRNSFPYQTTNYPTNLVNSCEHYPMSTKFSNAAKNNIFNQSKLNYYQNDYGKTYRNEKDYGFYSQNGSYFGNY